MASLSPCPMATASRQPIPPFSRSHSSPLLPDAPESSQNYKIAPFYPSASFEIVASKPTSPPPTSPSASMVPSYFRATAAHATVSVTSTSTNPPPPPLCTPTSPSQHAIPRACQQRPRHAHPRQHRQLPTSRLLQPGQIQLAQSHQRRLLCHLVQSNSFPGHQTSPKLAATAQGHIRQERQNLRWTQPRGTPFNENPTEPPRIQPHGSQVHKNSTKPSGIIKNSNKFQQPVTDRLRTNWVYQQAVKISGQIFSDQTGRFPVTSSRGNKYIMIVYNYDSNHILAEPLRSRSEHKLVRAYTKLRTTLSNRGIFPILQKLDNECPAGLKKFMLDKGVDYQLMPPHLHRTNAAEKAIRTWKDHFIAGLSSTDPAFPLHLWCRLIQQTTTTLNLLQPSRINPKLLAEAQLNGAFDCNHTPCRPPGTKVLLYKTPGVRRTWAPLKVARSYQSHRVYVTQTRTERIARTVEFFPHSCAMPKTSSADAVGRTSSLHSY
jgi:hypothetical protein